MFNFAVPIFDQQIDIYFENDAININKQSNFLSNC